MMRIVAKLLLPVVAVLPVSLFGGEIYGTLRMDQRRVAGVIVEIRFDGEARTARTGENGAYSIILPRRGPCTIVVKYGGQDPPPSLEAYSYEEGVRYDLILEKNDGRYQLKRG